MRYHTTGNSKPWKPASYKHESSLGGKFEQRRFDWFDCLCAVVIVALTIGTVAFIMWSSSK